MRFSDLFDTSVPTKPEPDYDEYIRRMEVMRINYNRMAASRFAHLDDPDRPGRAVRGKWGKIMFVRGHPGQMPLDLRAYVVAREYDPDKRTFGKIIPELVKHKHELHPFTRRYLLEQIRTKQNRHRKLADSYQAVADQFEIEDQPQSVSQNIAAV